MAKGSGTKKPPIKVMQKPKKMACGGAAKARKGYPMTKKTPANKSKNPINV